MYWLGAQISIHWDHLEYIFAGKVFPKQNEIHFMTILFNIIIWTVWWSMDSILTSKLLMQPAFCISQHQRKGRQVLFRNDRVSLQKHLVFVIHNILHRNIFFCDINLLGRFSFLYKNSKSLMLLPSKTCLDVILLAKLR